MRILLLGAGARLLWVSEVLQSLRSRSPGFIASLHVIEGPPRRELRLALGGDPPIILVLVDPIPFAASPSYEGVGLMEAVRADAERAVLAIELARRADRTVKLIGDDSSYWLATLSELSTDRPELTAPAALPLLPPGTHLCAPIVQGYLQHVWSAPSSATTIPVLTWPRESFIDGDTPGQPLPASIEVAGRSRILAYGPYLPLPVGNWCATAYLGFSPDIGKLPFILEVDTGTAISRGFFEVDRGGIYTLELDFVVSDFLHPIELRLISQDSALEGQASLIEVCLKQTP